MLLVANEGSLVMQSLSSCELEFVSTGPSGVDEAAGRGALSANSGWVEWLVGAAVEACAAPAAWTVACVARLAESAAPVAWQARLPGVTGAGALVTRAELGSGNLRIRLGTSGLGATAATISSISRLFLPLACSSSLMAVRCNEPFANSSRIRGNCLPSRAVECANTPPPRTYGVLRHSTQTSKGMRTLDTIGARPPRQDARAGAH
jgi:hypothetical protein